MDRAKPAHEIRLGLIKVAIWRTNTRSGERHNVTATRLFKNGDTWTHSQHFGRDDILLLAKALDRAHSWILENQFAHGGTSNGEPAP